MIDENAFGLLIGYLNIEDDEYDREREEFVVRYQAFSTLLRNRLRTQPPASVARAIVLGHAFYIELLDDDIECDLIAWLRATRVELGEHGYVTAGVLTYGSSWYGDEEPRPATVEWGSVRVGDVSGPSEPLRRALAADAASREDEDAEMPGWGSGLYLDVDAVEALGRRPKNQPTILRSGGAQFFRAGS